MWIKTRIKVKEIRTSANFEDTAEILQLELNLKKQYSWWNPFEIEKNQFDGVIKGNTFELRQNIYYQILRPTVNKIAGLFWKIEGKIVKEELGSSIILSASYTFFARFTSLAIVIVSILTLLDIWEHPFLIDIIIDSLLIGFFFFFIFYMIPKSINKTTDHLFATIEKSLKERKTRHNKS